MFRYLYIDIIKQCPERLDTGYLNLCTTLEKTYKSKKVTHT